MSKGMQTWRVIGLLAAGFLLAAACGSQQPTPQSKDASEGPAAVSSIDEAKDATIYIEAQGGYFDIQREFGEVSYGQGSGFIIDQDGTAITANHVVTGSSYLNIYVPGEVDPLRAEVLGVSECSDLALIDIEGEGYPFIEWRRGQIDSGLEVTAIGYPAEDVPTGEQPDETVTNGIINTMEASGETSWASVESVIEHQALLRPGDSGGPLVDNEGKAVGINFASAESDRYVAISKDEAQPIISELHAGDIESIGVNGEAIAIQKIPLSGIYVGSVETGSPAFKVGLRGESPTRVEVIVRLEETTLAEDGTMKTYCDILRSHSGDDPLAIDVERWTFDANGNLTDISILSGVLRGKEPLQKNETETEERLNQLFGES